MVPQLLLLEESWRELFVLGAGEYFPPLDLTALLGAGLKGQTLRHEVAVFQETVLRLRALALDPTEYGLLRAIVLFKTGKCHVKIHCTCNAQVLVNNITYIRWVLMILYKITNIVGS